MTSSSISPGPSSTSALVETVGKGSGLLFPAAVLPPLLSLPDEVAGHVHGYLSGPDILRLAAAGREAARTVSAATFQRVAFSQARGAVMAQKGKQQAEKEKEWKGVALLIEKGGGAKTKADWEFQPQAGLSFVSFDLLAVLSKMWQKFGKIPLWRL